MDGFDTNISSFQVVPAADIITHPPHIDSVDNLGKYPNKEMMDSSSLKCHLHNGWQFVWMAYYDMNTKKKKSWKVVPVWPIVSGLFAFGSGPTAGPSANRSHQKKSRVKFGNIGWQQTSTRTNKQSVRKQIVVVCDRDSSISSSSPSVLHKTI